MNTPNHIAFILDGNRRWAKEHGLTAQEGHDKGFENMNSIIRECVQRGINYMTLYAWSTENHKNRDETERKHIFGIFEKIKESIDLFHEEEIRFDTIGELEALPFTTRTALEWIKKETRKYTKRATIAAINYGGRNEITRAVQNIIQDGLSYNEITEETISNYLDTKEYPDPDLVIRTGKGNQRLSNYLPWQAAYAELYFPGVYWPEFDGKCLDKAIEFFSNTKRNFGK